MLRPFIDLVGLKASPYIEPAMKWMFVLVTTLLLAGCKKENEESQYYMSATVDGVAVRTIYFNVQKFPQTEQPSIVAGLFDNFWIGLRLDQTSPTFEPGVYNFREVLPATLLSFTVVVQSGKPVLQWSTAQESGMQSFILERSLNGTNFTPIDTVAATNTSSVHDYESTDSGAHFISRYYYRLKMVESNGAFQYSAVRLYNGDTNYTAYLETSGYKYRGFNGFVKIITHDRSQRTISGNFSFDVKDSSGRLIPIRDGSFSIYY